MLTAPRELHPSEDLSKLPLLVATAHGLYARFNARLYSRTGVSPIAFHRLTGGNPVAIAGGFSLIAMGRINRRMNKVDPGSCIPLRRHGATANVAYAHHNNNGNVPDEMNMKLSKCMLPQKGTGDQVVLPSHLFPHSGAKSKAPNLRNLQEFQIFLILPYQSCTLPPSSCSLPFPRSAHK